MSEPLLVYACYDAFASTMPEWEGAGQNELPQAKDESLQGDSGNGCQQIRGLMMLYGKDMGVQIGNPFTASGRHL